MRKRDVYGQSILFFLLIVGIGLLRFAVEQYLKLPYGCLIYMIYITFFFQWMYRARRLFPQKNARRCITLFCLLLIFFSVVRVVKWDFVDYNGTMIRYMWYLFYVPIVLIPVLNVRTMLYIDLPDDGIRPRWWYLMYLPAGLMIAGVLTNDLHQWAFRFPADMANWEQSYTYGPLFSVVTGWVALLIVVMLVITVRTCISRRLYRSLWMPAVVVCVGLVYFLTYNAHDMPNKFFLQKMYEVSDLTGLLWILLWESLVVTRLIPSSDGHANAFAASSLRAGLADETFVPIQVSSLGVRPLPEQLRAAANGETALPDGDTILKARPVRGGWFYWAEDVRALHELSAALEDTADYLSEEHAFLQQTAQIEEEHRRTLHRTELYDSIAQQIRPRLQLLETMLSDVPEDEEAFCGLLKRAAVIYAFLKRYPNLLLLADAEEPADSREILRCLKESANTLRQMGVRCDMRVDPAITLRGETAADVYDLFEAVIEENMAELAAVSFTLREINEKIVLEIGRSGGEAALSGGCVPPAAIREAAERVGTAGYSSHGGAQCWQIVIPGEVAAK